MKNFIFGNLYNKIKTLMLAKFKIYYKNYFRGLIKGVMKI